MTVLRQTQPPCFAALSRLLFELDFFATLR